LRTPAKIKSQTDQYAEDKRFAELHEKESLRRGKVGDVHAACGKGDRDFVLDQYYQDCERAAQEAQPAVPIRPGNRDQPDLYDKQGYPCAHNQAMKVDYRS